MNFNYEELNNQAKKGNYKSLARLISLIENEAEGFDYFLEHLKTENHTPIIGITGPPGAGKSTLTNCLITEWLLQDKKIAILCVDPSSPFNMGAVLGDRIRMDKLFLHPNIYIRSLASRGSLGGLHPKIMEISSLLQNNFFDLIIIETVGVGQSEIEISGLADITAVVLVPEAGDEVQTMKAGLLEIADLFILNKADRPESSTYISNLKLMLAPAFSRKKEAIAILKTIATQSIGITEVVNSINKLMINNEKTKSDRKLQLLAEKVYYLIRQKRMKDISRNSLLEKIKLETNFNLYKFIKNY